MSPLGIAVLAILAAGVVCYLAVKGFRLAVDHIVARVEAVVRKELAALQPKPPQPGVPAPGPTAASGSPALKILTNDQPAAPPDIANFPNRERHLWALIDGKWVNCGNPTGKSGWYGSHPPVQKADGTYGADPYDAQDEKASFVGGATPKDPVGPNPPTPPGPTPDRPPAA